MRRETSKTFRLLRKINYGDGGRVCVITYFPPLVKQGLPKNGILGSFAAVFAEISKDFIWLSTHRTEIGRKINEILA